MDRKCVVKHTASPRDRERSISVHSSQVTVFSALHAASCICAVSSQGKHHKRTGKTDEKDFFSWVRLAISLHAGGQCSSKT